MAENAPSTPPPLPRQPELTPPAAPPAPVPSLAFYGLLVVVALFLIGCGFWTKSDRWSGLWMNLGSNLLAVVIVLIVIDRRVRPGEMSRVRGATSGAARAASLLWPEARDAAGYARSLMIQLGEVVPANYLEVPALAGIASKGDGSFVLLGAPGTGKTTLLHVLAMHKAKETARRPLRGKLPVVFPLRLWKADRNAEANVREFVQRFYPMSDRRFHKLLRRGRFMLFLDGLAEVDPRTGGAVVRQLMDLRRRHPGTGIILSTRPTATVGAEELPVVEVPGLTPEQHEELLGRLSRQ